MEENDPIKQIEEVASLQFTDAEIQIICELPDQQMLQPEIIRAIQKGRLEAEAMVRRSVKQMANQGSTPAQKQYFELIQRRKAVIGGPSETDPELAALAEQK
jgi:hypothetical protein